MNENSNDKSVVSRQPFDQAQDKSSVASADNLNTANPANPVTPAIDDAPLPFSLKPPGSSEPNAPIMPAAVESVKEAQSPATNAPATQPPSAKVAAPSAPISVPPPPPKPVQAPKAGQDGFLKNIFRRKTAVPRTQPPFAKATVGASSPSGKIPVAAPSPAIPSAPAPRQGSGQAPQTIGKAAIIRRPTRRAALIIEIFAGILIALIATFFFFFYRAQININPTPAPDKILLDRKEVKTGNFKVKPGTHAVEIIKEGYVTYRLTREYKINQRVAITMSLLRATEPQTVLAGATTITAAQNNKLAFFLTQDGQIASVASEPQNGKFEPYVISNGSYLGAKKIIYSADNTYALGQFDDSIKIISFAKPDTLNQVEARLPLDAPQTSSITWNDAASNFAPAANSQIVYDKNDGNTWNLIQSDLQITKPSILMTIDPTRFNNIFLDWGMSTKKVLIVGRELGVLDLGTRIYEKINENINFKWGIWGPQGKYAVVIDENGDSYVLSDLKVKKLDLKTVPNLISWNGQNKAIIVSEGRPVQVDFDTGSRINYAEINGLKSAASFAVIGGRAVFADNIGVKIAPLTENIYKK